MTKLFGALGALATISSVLLWAGAAEALSDRTWVSGSSAANDSYPCSRAQPCRTFATAYAQTTAGGEIDVLDGGDFGSVTIRHSLTIANDGAGVGAITDAGTMIDINASATDSVVLRGLSLSGAYQPTSVGVRFDAGGSLLIDHCAIEGFQYAGIMIVPSAGAATVWVKDTVLVNDGGNSTYPSVWLYQNGGPGGAVAAHFERVQILNTPTNGIRVDGTHGASTFDVELRDVTVDAATGGSAIVAISPTSGGPSVKIFADNVTVSHNAGYGLRAVGGTSKVYLSRSVITDNGVGVGASSGGQIFSYGDNRFADNASGDGVTPMPIGPK